MICRKWAITFNLYRFIVASIMHSGDQLSLMTVNVAEEGFNAKGVIYLYGDDVMEMGEI